MKRIGFQWRCAEPNDQQINHETRGAELPSAPLSGRKLSALTAALDVCSSQDMRKGNIWHTELQRRNMTTYCSFVVAE